MKKNNFTSFIIVITIIILIILMAIFYYINGRINMTYEHFCKIPELNKQGEVNNQNVLLNYPPQSNIFTSSCDKYWKDWPLESNNLFADSEPIVINPNQLDLPKERKFGNNEYSAGLVDFYQLASITSDKIDFDITNSSSELLIDPITKEKLNYQYELDFVYLQLNKKTWINRWEKYNPSVKTTFDYDEIKSDIENVNILNKNFIEKLNIKQKDLLTDSQRVTFGLIPFEIFKYKILHINYLNNDPNVPVYIMQLALFRETDLYINTFSYIGYIDNSISASASSSPYIVTNVTYIGGNSTDTVLLADFYNPQELKQEIINRNFSNSPIIEKDPDAIVRLTKDHQESYKIKNQYACFNLNYDPILKTEYILPYYSREACESGFDTYNRPKNYGVYDKPCKEDSECPFYKINKNYDNDFGKCIDGTCQLPLNMENVGYHFYKNKKDKEPLCYNCHSKKFEGLTLLDTCCNEQKDREKYPFLKSPDYAFQDDDLARINYHREKKCLHNEYTNNTNCVP